MIRLVTVTMAASALLRPPADPISHPVFGMLVIAIVIRRSDVRLYQALIRGRPDL